MKKIAVPVAYDGNIDSHFGHCQSYSVFTADDSKQIIRVESIPSPQGCGCKSNIAAVLAEQGVSVMIAEGIGDGAINVLNYWGIDVVRGCSGNAETAVKQWLSGDIQDSGSSCAQHQHHHEGGHFCNH
ncbi:MAG: NifB/NifX family molybdenum-iron cluster-binding protein [Bacteroidales bacterium]|nr:NifB/NifX family molybdenum-iron cluster-binding protein [Bacteroidales bacterium]